MEDKEKYVTNPEILNILSKRARIVVEHIQREGYITTEQLKEMGYLHPPRAARDVREAGIPLVTFKVKSEDGRTIAAYKFADLSKIEKNKLQGRRIFSRTLKDSLYSANNGKCYICFTQYEKRYLQVDHRVPYEVVGDSNSANINANDFMLLCASCNRAKSWSCEHCQNWITNKSIHVCSSCYWCRPEKHTHIAQKEIRRVDITWQKEEISQYDEIAMLCRDSGLPLPEYIKERLKTR